MHGSNAIPVKWPLAVWVATTLMPIAVTELLQPCKAWGMARLARLAHQSSALTCTPSAGMQVVQHDCLNFVYLCRHHLVLPAVTAACRA